MPAMQTRTYWKNRVMNFYDEQLNPEFRSGLWANCPLQAIMADPQLGTIFFDDFFWIGNSGDIWTITEDAGKSGTDAVQDRAGGWYKQYCDADDNDESYLHTAGESWLLAEDKALWFEAEIEWTNSGTTDGNFMCGLFEDAGALGSMQDDEAGPPDDYDGLNFYKANGLATIAFETSIATAQVTANLTEDYVSGTVYRLGAYWDGIGTVTPYLDGVAGTAHTMGTGGGECNALAGGCSSDGTAEEAFEVGYVKIVQLR